jgi:hypothetical protein
MTPRLLVLGLAPLLATATARAQAPGEVAPEAAPPVVDPCGGRESVMARRFAIGVSFGGLGVAPEGAADGAETNFNIGELAIRYRASRRFELELAMSGGRQALDEGEEGELAAGSVTFGLRYRFRPEHKWNWWLMAGLGASVIARADANDDEREAAQRPVGMFGIGLERRFRRFALQAELRAVGMGPRADAMDPKDLPVVADDGGMAPEVAPRVPIQEVGSEDLSGGTFTIGASYYF